MKKRLLFLDLDGTLLNDAKQITAGNREALERTLQRGHGVIIATGRPLKSALEQSRRLGLDKPGCYTIAYNGAMVYDDYAHHPDELHALLSTAKTLDYNRVIVAFQPHTYSRLSELFHDFARSFLDADRIIVADVYAAREENTYEVSSKLLAQTIGRQAEYIDSFEGIAEYLKQNVFEGDVIIIMGAGDTYRLFPLMGLS